MQEFRYLKICDMSIDNAIEGFYLLKSAVLRSTGGGKPYLTGKLQDTTGEIDYVIWDYTGTVHDSSLGLPVKVRGTVSAYNGNIQVSIVRIRAIQDSDNVDLSQIIPVAPIDAVAGYKEVKQMLSELQDPDYRNIALELLKRHEMTFVNVPAAKGVHHAFLHGVLMHTLNMMRTAKYFAELYKDTPINASLLIAATFCHDINKDREMLTTRVGLVDDYSVEGELLGHSYMSAREIHEVGAALKIPEAKTMLMEHLILSHHGQPDWGAAVTPRCAEAALLHLIDMVDSRMEIYREAYLKVTPGEFTEKVYALGNRAYFPEL